MPSKARLASILRTIVC
uniref:Uncharacterized protein n=1 Tax=Rhizophora mucronata TaxID=61149 RepID=A0A2P2PQ77_RHIMU